MANYTWAHDLDVSTDSNGGGTPMNPYWWKADYGNSNWDIRHRFVATFVYDIPFFAVSNPVLKGVFAHWQSNGIVTLQTGIPFNVSTGTDTANTGSSGTYRPDLVHAPTDDCGRGHLVGCIDATAFTVQDLYPVTPSNYAYGSAGRNLLHGPGSETVNFSLFKNLPDQGAPEVPVPLRDLRAVQSHEFRQSGGHLGYVVVRQHHQRQREPQYSVRGETAVLTAPRPRRAP